MWVCVGICNRWLKTVIMTTSINAPLLWFNRHSFKHLWAVIFKFIIHEFLKNASTVFFLQVSLYFFFQNNAVLLLRLISCHLHWFPSQLRLNMNCCFYQFSFKILSIQSNRNLTQFAFNEFSICFEFFLLFSGLRFFDDLGLYIN